MYTRKGRIPTMLVALTLAVAVGATCTQPADAWWFFWRKKSADGVEKKKAARKLAAVSVGLVPGNPAALYWKPDGKPRAAVLCLHELGLYNGVFDSLGQRMSKQGLAVYAIDLRGFGGWSDVESPEAAMDLDRTLADVKGSVEIIRKLNPDLPVFILGEAMGGALALKAAASFPELISGIISAAPGGEHFNTTKNYAAVAGKVVTAGYKKEFDYGEELLEAATAKDELKDSFRSDPKVRLNLQPRELMACQFFMYKTRQMAKQIKNTPVLVVHGAKDGESREIGSSRVFKALATKDKEYLNVPDGDHYTYEDTNVSDHAFEKTLGWIDKHISEKPGS